jgi:hypothetical protein
VGHSNAAGGRKYNRHSAMPPKQEKDKKTIYLALANKTIKTIEDKLRDRLFYNIDARRDGSRR